jgi:hypothetical protein
MRLNKLIIFPITIIIAGSSCKKLVVVPEPVKSITTSETFGTLSTANAALLAIYSDMSYGGNNPQYGNGLTSIDAGMSGDELLHFGDPSNAYATNNLLSTGDQGALFWKPAYFDIYMTNAAIEGLQKSATLPSSVKDTLTGEAKFLRAFCYFYLVNLFGDIPLLTSTDFATNSIATRTPSILVYQQIIADLTEAQNILPIDFSKTGGEKVRATKWAAASLLARVYLYVAKYDAAEAEATMVINNPAFSLVNNITIANNGFKKNNSEAILQLQSNNPQLYATIEGNIFVTTSNTVNPNYYLTNQLLNAFEPNDKRKIAWTNTTTFQNTVYYYPYKYQSWSASSLSSATEYYTLLRLAEQFLIRAEARAQQNNLSGAIADLNVIRTRAGLPNLSSILTQQQVLAAVAQENRIEFFAEWGHRWFDLKRTGQADAVLGTLKGANWQTTDQLFPIPQSEINYDYNLTQNPEY